MATPSITGTPDSSQTLSLGLPAALPGSVTPFASALCDALQVRTVQRDRITAITEALPSLGVVSVGIESDIDDPERNVDFSVGANVQRSSIADVSREPVLADLARAAVRRGCESMWWEFDTSAESVTEGAFVTVSADVDGWQLLGEALTERPDLRAAAEHVHRALDGLQSRGLVGAFPSRPAAAALATMAPEDVPAALRALHDRGIPAPSAEDPLVRHLLEQVDQAAISCGAHPSGLIVAGVEVAFEDRVRAMVDRRWTPMLTDPSTWSAERREALAPFVRMQGAHPFSGALPMVFFYGIDHVKLSPRPDRMRVKVYAGGSLVMLDSGASPTANGGPA